MKNLGELMTLVAELGKVPDALGLLKSLAANDITAHSEDWRKGKQAVLSKVLPAIIESDSVSENVKSEASVLLREIAKSL